MVLGGFWWVPCNSCLFFVDHCGSLSLLMVPVFLFVFVLWFLVVLGFGN